MAVDKEITNLVFSYYHHYKHREKYKLRRKNNNFTTCVNPIINNYFYL